MNADLYLWAMITVSAPFGLFFSVIAFFQIRAFLRGEEFDLGFGFQEAQNMAIVPDMLE